MKQNFFALIILTTLVSCSTNKLYAPHINIDNLINKKGICLCRYNRNDQTSIENFNSLNVSWYYTWSPKTNNENINAELVPMIWGKYDVTDENIEYIKSGFKNKKYQFCLGFNEPDMKEQSNLSVDEAIELWPKLMEIGIPLVSPACAWDYDGWLDPFMTKIKENKYRVDAIALHCYQDFSNPNISSSLITLVNTIWEKYHLPIWLTEFGAIDTGFWYNNTYNPNCNEANAKTYMRDACFELEKCGHVFRYSWFLDNYTQTKYASSERPKEGEFCALFDDNDSITPIGRTYQAIKSNKPLMIDSYFEIKANNKEDIFLKIKASGGFGDYKFYAEKLPNSINLNSNGDLTIAKNIKQKGEYKIFVKDQSNQVSYTIINIV